MQKCVLQGASKFMEARWNFRLFKASSLFVFRACCLINEMVMKPAPTSPLLGPGSGVSERKWKRVAAVEMGAAELLMNELTSKVLQSVCSATHDYSFFCLKKLAISTRARCFLWWFCFLVLWQRTPQHFLSAAWAYFLITALCVWCDVIWQCYFW